MHTLVIASQKGGSGKTTLSGHLAVEAECAGAGPVALIDADPQGSLAKWWNTREAASPAFVCTPSLDLEHTLSELEAAGIRLVIVDTPSGIVSGVSKVVASADFVLVPMRPSPHDIRTVRGTIDIAERAKKPFAFVVNDAALLARITADTAVALSQHGTVAPITLRNHVDYSASMVDGRTVGETAPQSKSAEDIRALWKYVSDRLQRSRPETKSETKNKIEVDTISSAVTAQTEIAAITDISVAMNFEIGSSSEESLYAAYAAEEIPVNRDFTVIAEDIPGLPTEAALDAIAPLAFEEDVVADSIVTEMPEATYVEVATKEIPKPTFEPVMETAALPSETNQVLPLTPEMELDFERRDYRMRHFGALKHRASHPFGRRRSEKSMQQS